MEQYYNLLENVKNKIKDEIALAVYNDKIDPLKEIYKVENNSIYLVVSNQFDKFTYEKYHAAKLNDILNTFTEEKMQFKFITKKDATEEKAAKEALAFDKVDPKESVIKERILRPEYTFDNFVTGEANREAFTFALKVAESPHVTVNPFYIFGDVGLGKTHLMMSIGHYILDRNINANIVYTTAQQFVEDYFKSKNKNLKNAAFSASFDEYYRSADVLLVDDIQYLADKQGSQDEFFKIFEYLFENNKQIIVTSDRKASELNIMARLKSRFTWGMQADVRKPNVDLRKAIIKNKLNHLIADPSVVEDSVLNYIAENFSENVRELEGALRRFINYCVVLNREFNLETAVSALESIIPTNCSAVNDSSSIQIDKVKELVSSYFNISEKDLTGNSRKQDLVYARNLAIYLSRTKYNVPLKKIGECFNRDHATVVHSVKKIEDDITMDEFIKQDVDNLIKKLNT